MSRPAHLLPLTLVLACVVGADDPQTGTATDATTSDAATSDAATSDAASMSSTSGGSTTADLSGTLGTQSTGGTTTTGDTSSTSNPMTDGGVDCVLVPGLDGVPRCSMCDVWAQDCPEGEKCSAWASDAGSSWDATHCVPVGTDAPGEPCTVEGSPTSGVDSCALGAMCWDVDPNTLEGTCVGLCDGSDDAPTCADPETSCVITNEGVLNLCLATCDPILQDCGEAESCVPFGGAFHCAPVVDDPGGYGDSCENIATCSPGLACIAGELIPGCIDNACCSPFCLTTEPNLCPGMPDVACVAWFEPGEAPVGLEELGVCAIP